MKNFSIYDYMASTRTRLAGDLDDMVKRHEEWLAAIESRNGKPPAHFVKAENDWRIGALKMYNAIGYKDGSDLPGFLFKLYEGGE